MKYEEHKVTGIRMAYIGGGSRSWARKFMTDLAMEPSMSGEVVLYDLNLKSAENNKIIGNMIDQTPGVKGRWHYSVAATLKEALTGADFVVISIQPGTFEEMEVDVHMPERLNVWQSVGDTVGPGGIIRALRTLPMFVPMAEAVRDYCPDAWVINYTNPMALCVQVLYHVFPEIKAFGCCHEVFNTQEVLALAAAEYLGIPKPERRDIHINVMGTNHFTWFTRASYEGVDLFPVYRDFINKYKDGFTTPGKYWEDSTFHCAHLVKFDLFKRFGYIAAAGDRHLAEFMPGDEYLKDPETVRSWKFGLTGVQWRKDNLAKQEADVSAMLSGAKAVDMEPTGEEGVLLMKALVGMDRVVSNVNIPNSGQIANLPLGAVVETNALFSRDCIQPVIAGPMPEALYRLTIPHVENQARVLEAALNCDRDLVVKAFLADPNFSAKCSDEGETRRLVDDMIQGTIKYLHDGWKA